ncbi:hypothetical protein [Dactylosporangium sp. CA-139066]|uniref:hypothetical protein n=1 Tax=Dactylosporangium sp. CA-139066 TaxID=3239930 RepID=UPI003D8B5DA2
MPVISNSYAPTLRGWLTARRPRPAPWPAVEEEDTNATRHLSAGAYLDEEFCRSALREIYYRPKRIVAPSHGFDTLAVLGHCLRSRRAMTARDTVIVGALVTAAWLSIPALLTTLGVCLAVHVVATTAVVGRDSIRYLRDSLHFGGGHGQAARGDSTHPRTFRRLWLENLYAQVVARVVGLATMYVTFIAVAAVAHLGLLGDSWIGSLSVFVLAGPVTAVFLAVALCRAWSHRQLRDLKPRKATRRPVHNARLEQIGEQLGGNTVVFSGYQPFVGSGRVLRRWDLTQRLVVAPPPLVGAAERETESKREFARPPFTANEISEYVRDHIRSLANDALPERRLPALTVHDRIFVAGTEISTLRPHSSPERVREIIRNPTAPERHYLVCQVVSWHGELVTTVYVHFAVQGKSLYLELQVTGLLPCDERFRVVDQVGGTAWTATFRAGLHALVATPATVAAAPGALARAGRDLLTIRMSGRRRSTGVAQGFDYGAAIALRELGQSAEMRDHMQTQDVIKYGRIIERRVLAAVLDFLEQRGVDVTEYRQRSLTILSAGAVAMEGGTVNVTGDAVGTQNTTTTTGEQ